MIKKIICLFIGHKIKHAQCPVTKISLSSCERCNFGNSSTHSKMNFR
jgi:hypothetical protein